MGCVGLLLVPFDVIWCVVVSYWFYWCVFAVLCCVGGYVLLGYVFYVFVRLFVFSCFVWLYVCVGV